MNLIHDNKTNRFVVLFSLYIAVGGHYDFVKNIKVLAEHNAISSRDFKSAFRYLSEENLIELSNGEEEYYGSITHKGLKAVEDVFIDTNQPTYYFPAYRDMKG